MENQFVKVAIVEDSKSDMDNCLDLLRRYGKEKNIDFDIETFESGNDFIEHFRSQYNFVILDINLSLTNGIDIAKTIRKTDEEVIIMFATNLAKYATKGYEVDAIDFALKPLSYASFYLKLERVMKRLGLKEKSFLVVSCKDGMRKIDLNSILYLEVISHDIIVHMLGGENVYTSGTLKKYEESLKANWFIRCNSCYLVNASNIKRIDKLNVELVNGETVFVSHPKRKAFTQSFKEYVMKGGK